ncbi:MAG: GIY-YIG nuclease family protein [Crocinitomicaceae bacterium]|nr:GIY-YIG nuclease family protein [Crocinitomicaceae bacterium]
MFFTYILHSEKIDRYYIGHSQNIANRLIKHNNGKVKSTKAGAPWKCVYFESFETRSEAFNREMEIKKKKSKRYITNLIQK